MRALLVPQAEILGDVLVLIDARLNLHGAVHQLLFRELEINQVPQSISQRAAIGGRLLLPSLCEIYTYSHDSYSYEYWIRAGFALLSFLKPLLGNFMLCR